MSGRSVGIDVGGTFTDLVAIDADGRVESCKTLSTPADQSLGVVNALHQLSAPPAALARVVHGTTVATNMLLERTGARVVLCATEGASDLLELRRQERASLYDLARHHPPPLAPPECCISVPERVEPAGVVRPLTPEDARAVAALVRQRTPEVVAVALLHSYAEPAHEQLLRSALRAELPDVELVLSSDVLPEIREYERCATTAAEAYLRPGVRRYLVRLAERLEREGYPRPAVMTSGGGMSSAGEAARSAAALALSGPAGGVVGAAFVAGLAGFRDALTIDIGGTSADAGVIVDGVPLTEAGGAVAGVPIALPRVLVETVSAGGGSIGWVDDGGALRVGPRSAGAVPGPAAFARGGTDATVTDAHCALGNVRPTRLSGGITLHLEEAHGAVERLARRIGATRQRAAEAMIATVNAAMARALRRVSVERGVDPRRGALVAFGGGGGLHACGLAEHLGIRTVLVPPLAGVLSALGLAIAAERREALVSVMREASTLDGTDIHQLADRLAERAGPGEVRQWWVRARYLGQGHELEVPFAPGESGEGIVSRFNTLHDERYGFTLPHTVEIVSARHAALGHPYPVQLTRTGDAGWREDDLVDTGGPLNASVRGPAVIMLPDATLLVHRGWTSRALPLGGWLVEQNP